jgi:hypothetical protein
VRSTGKSAKSVSLDRQDATNLLRADFPVCVAIVDDAPSVPTAWVRPLDSKFREQLLSFLASDARTLSIKPADCVPWSDIRQWLVTVKFGSVEEGRISAAQHRLQETIGDVSLEVRRDSGGAVTVVTALDLYDIYATPR